MRPNLLAVILHSPRLVDMDAVESWRQAGDVAFDGDRPVWHQLGEDQIAFYS